MSSAVTFDLIEHERLRLADLAETWPAEAWDVPSLARGWHVHEVVAHLTMPFAVGLPAMVVGLVRHRGSFDRFADRWACDTARAVPPAELVATLRANAASRFTPPGMGPEAPLTDLVVHGLDVRIPLGLPGTDIDPAARATALQFLTTSAASRFGVAADTFATRHLEAADLDWSHGSGPTVRATSIELLTHLCRATPLPARPADAGADVAASSRPDPTA